MKISSMEACVEISVNLEDSLPEDVNPLYKKIYKKYPHAEIDGDDNYILIIRLYEGYITDMEGAKEEIRRIIEEYGD